MEKKLWWALNALGFMALVATLVLGYEVWQLMRPIPQLPLDEILKIEEIVKEFRKNRSLILPEENREGEQHKVDVETSAAVEVIKNHIISVMIPEIKGFGVMNRNEYARAIAEALVSHTRCIEDAFWVCGMAQTESSFRVWAKPNPKTRSSARGLLQVIVKYHEDVLRPLGISKDELSTDIDKSVQGGAAVFYKYLYKRNGEKRTYRDATKRYRSLSVEESEQLRYYTKIATVFNKLKSDLRKELKSA